MINTLSLNVVDFSHKELHLKCYRGSRPTNARVKKSRTKHIYGNQTFTGNSFIVWSLFPECCCFSNCCYCFFLS